MIGTSTTRRGSYSLKARLYAVIGLLALLPICGVVVALTALESSTRDKAALDRATRGTIRLERINGLVYAVVMESRGVYMSPNWPTAEKFAQNLTAHLAELEEAAAAWKQEAIASQQANVEELGRRIEHFVRFRTELVRLGKEDSTAAARAFGDNDANRNVRAALNQSLTILARAYEQEIGRARSMVEAGERNLMIALLALAGVAAIALGIGVLLVHSSLLVPLLRLKDQMLRLAQGDLDSVPDQRQRAVEIADMGQAVEVFRRDLIDRQRLTRDTNRLSTLNEWLHSCNSLDELYDMVSMFLVKMLPECAGNLFIYANSRDVLECVKIWNGGKMTPAIHPEDCWGLRRGRPYIFGESEIEFPCAHAEAPGIEAYCCIPILAHGETIGLLYLEFRPSERAERTAERPRVEAADLSAQRRLGIVCAGQISLAIANVKLRDQLRDQSIRDPLTGLFNRRYLMETGRREFARAARSGQSVSVLSIDVDNFKKYNDNHGHDAGDTVLRAIGNCLETLFRSEDVPCRFGGEEFLVMLPGATIDVAARRAELLRGKVEGLVVRYMNQDLPRITMSIGVAAFPAAGDTAEAVMRVADEALYRAKTNGRNRVETASVSGGDSKPPEDRPSAPLAASLVAPRPALADAADG